MSNPGAPEPDPVGLSTRIATAVETRDAEVLFELLDPLPYSEALREPLILSPEDRDVVLALVPAEMAADLVEEAPAEMTGELTERQTATRAAEILEELDSDVQADLIGELDEQDAGAILSEMDAGEAADLRRLATYENDTAGGPMVSGVCAFADTQTVGKVLRELASEDDDFERYRVRRSAPPCWRSESASLKRRGVVGDEVRSMPTWITARRRLAGLSANILLNILAPSVISAYEETLLAVIAIAVFLPMVSDMSGCSGNQAVGVTMRELSLGLVRPMDALRVWGTKISVGVINGLALGVLIGLALALNTMLAVSIGGVVPLPLKRIGQDPAAASGPPLTTITDMAGFFFVLSLATLMMHWLT